MNKGLAGNCVQVKKVPFFKCRPLFDKFPVDGGQMMANIVRHELFEGNFRGCFVLINDRLEVEEIGFWLY